MQSILTSDVLYSLFQHLKSDWQWVVTLKYPSIPVLKCLVIPTVFLLKNLVVSYRLFFISREHTEWTGWAQRQITLILKQTHQHLF